MISGDLALKFVKYFSVFICLIVALSAAIAIFSGPQTEIVSTDHIDIDKLEKDITVGKSFTFSSRLVGRKTVIIKSKDNAGFTDDLDQRVQYEDVTYYERNLSTLEKFSAALSLFFFLPLFPFFMTGKC